MPWPKGKPRKGHINKDGKPHARKGSKLVAVVRVDDSISHNGRGWPTGRADDSVRSASGKKVRGAASRQPTQMDEATEELPVGSDSDKFWGYKSTNAVTETCPNCFYVYADGGYCPECGWSASVVRDEYDSNRGRKFR